MTISSRFAEHGVVGAFFWIMHLILFAGLQPPPDEAMSRLLEWSLGIEQQPDFVATLAVTVMGALAAVSIFITGLLLDLLPSPLWLSEMNVFRRQLEQNRDWMEPLVKQNALYAAADWESFVARFGNPFGKAEWKANFGHVLFWSKRHRAAWIDQWKRLLERWKLRRAYERLWTFVMSYVLVSSGSGQMQMLMDQHYLWRTGRAIGTALYVVYFEAVIIFPDLLLGSSGMSLFIVMFLPLVVLALEYILTVSAYSRLSSTLFSLAYVTSSRAATGREG